MTPYYADDLVTLYHGDALEVLPDLTAGTAHAVITDPPYIIGAVSSGALSSKSGGWADMMNSSGWFTSWYRHADPNDVRAYLAALRAQRHRVGDGTEKPRPVAELIAGVERNLGRPA